MTYSEDFKALMGKTAEAVVPWPFVRISEHEMHPDPSRVIAKSFLHGQEKSITGYSRASAVLNRVLALPEEEAVRLAVATIASFKDRHRNLEFILESNYSLVADRLDAPKDISFARRMLIGAYFTQEYAIESAALFNPSIVPHPDQSNLKFGETRYVMSLRGVGEGHVSCIEFRTGIIDAEGRVTYDPISGRTALSAVIPTVYSAEVFRHQYTELGGNQEEADFLMDAMPPEFTREDLDRTFAWLEKQELDREIRTKIINRMEWIASCNYSITFPPDSDLNERVILPNGPSEINGMEDVRMVKLLKNGHHGYYCTYTAYDGHNIAPQVLYTEDFLTFTISQITGPAAKDKGVALFPRKVNGHFMALSRWDKENNLLATSKDLVHWDNAGVLLTPTLPWEMFVLGNCGSPLETEAGWLVLTHGVGPMREYSIGAALLDLDNPIRVIAKLEHPLLSSSPDNRDGYVPNVVYSCGAMIHGDSLILPHGCNDTTVRIAIVNVPDLIEAMTPIM